MRPRWFFGIPGGALLTMGMIVTAWLAPGPRLVAGIKFDYHTLIYGAAAIMLGYQSLLFAAFAKLMAVETGLHPPVTKLFFLEERNVFERLVAAGILLGLTGVGFGLFATWDWSETGFGDLDASLTIRPVIFSILFLVLGGQTALAGCFLGIINLLATRRAQLAFRQMGVPVAAADRALPKLSSVQVQG